MPRHPPRTHRDNIPPRPTSAASRRIAVVFALAVALSPLAIAAPATRSATSRPAAALPTWRLREGAPLELQSIVDNQPTLRDAVLSQFAAERNNIAARLNEQGVLVRLAPAEHDAAVQRIAAMRARVDDIDLRTRQIKLLKSPAIAELNPSVLLPLETRPDRDGAAATTQPTARSTTQATTQSAAGQSAVAIGILKLQDAIVVNVIDAHSAVMRARARTRSGAELVVHDQGTSHVWMEEPEKIVDVQPFIADGLATTNGWKPGNRQTLSQCMIVHLFPETVTAGGESFTGNRVAFFTLDDFERVGW